ncbi:unnamed protein product [Peniophora sp. CBMAI 1063]|nr:unnamed protein product [Peniophora sp. CBMAI 1063]
MQSSIGPASSDMPIDEDVISVHSQSDGAGHRSRSRSPSLRSGYTTDEVERADTAPSRPSRSRRKPDVYELTDDQSSSSDDDVDDTRRLTRHKSRLAQLLGRVHGPEDRSPSPMAASDDADDTDSSGALIPSDDEESLADTGAGKDPFMRDSDDDEGSPDLEDELPEDDECTLPPAFTEHPRLRFAYVNAFVQSVFHQAKDDAVHQQLYGAYLNRFYHPT